MCSNHFGATPLPPSSSQCISTSLLCPPSASQCHLCAFQHRPFPSQYVPVHSSLCQRLLITSQCQRSVSHCYSRASQYSPVLPRAPPGTIPVCPSIIAVHPDAIPVPFQLTPAAIPGPFQRVPIYPISIQVHPIASQYPPSAPQHAPSVSWCHLNESWCQPRSIPVSLNTPSAS